MKTAIDLFDLGAGSTVDTESFGSTPLLHVSFQSNATDAPEIELNVTRSGALDIAAAIVAEAIAPNVTTKHPDLKNVSALSAGLVGAELAIRVHEILDARGFYEPEIATADVALAVAGVDPVPSVELIPA